jgi:hypothetical protein
MRTLALSSLSLILVVACGPGSHPDESASCSDGETRCSGLTYETCTDGHFVESAVCPAVCQADLGCVVCEPGTGTCNGAEQASICRPDGSAYDQVTCDSVQGVACNPGTGVCEGPCAPQTLGQSYIGCDYFPTVTGNYVSAEFSFAVAVANTTNSMATITMEGGGLSTAETFTVAAQSVNVHVLPWVEKLKYCVDAFAGACQSPYQLSTLASGGAYRLRSTVPVTVYQFNPLQYTLGGDNNSFSNDASLLLPVNAWGREYVAAAWQTQGNHPSLLAITAHDDGTMVTINPKTSSTAEDGAPGFTAGTAQTVMLNRGDVLELGGNTEPGDFTGSLVSSDKAVQVIGGHYCANVPDGVAYCDHLEESIFPITALSTRYVVVAPAVTTIPAGKEEVVRFIATTAGTTLTFDPPQAGAPTTLANAGDYAEISQQAGIYLVTADHKILVAQYMEGSSAGGGTGDPAMALAVPVDQYRDNYLFHSPTNYETNYVDVVAPDGSDVMLDGVSLTGWTTIGTSGFSLVRVVPLDNGPLADGNHTIVGNHPFGISVYGYGQDTSYWYPGGLDLTDIPID